MMAVAIVVTILSLASQPAIAGLRSSSFVQARRSVAKATGAAAQGAQAPVGEPASLGGCPADILAFYKCALDKAKTFNPPRMASGKPDLQGYWRSRLTLAFSVEGVSETEPLTRDPVTPWIVGPGEIVDPPDRKIPYQPWAAEIGRKGQNFQKYIDARTACGSGGVPRVVHQGPHQILQREDYLVWLFEDHQVYRIIATNGQPHIGKDIKLWEGDAVGRWEGNTLVIDVTNVNGHNWLDDAGNFHTDAAHLVERLTMIDPDTIHYEITLEDPKVFTRPWTMAWPLTREAPGFELLEEACQEGEHDMPKFLKLGFTYYFGAPWRSR